MYAVLLKEMSVMYPGGKGQKVRLIQEDLKAS